MSIILPIDLGTPNAGNGDPLRDGGTSINTNFANLNLDKLEKGGYTGTAQDLKNEIDNFGADQMLKATYDPTNVNGDAFLGANISIDDANFKVLIGNEAQENFARTDEALLNVRQTGFRYGYITLNGDLGVASTFNHGELKGEILIISDPVNPVYTSFTVPPGVNLSPTEGQLTYYYIDPSTPNVLNATPTAPTEEQRRQRAYLFRAFKSGGVIIGIDSERTLIQQGENALRQLFEVVGDGRKNGLEVTNTLVADLSFKTTSGVSTGYDLDPTNYENPHEKTNAEFNTSTGNNYFVATTLGINGTPETQVKVDQYQDGAGGLIALGNNKYSVWYVSKILATGTTYLIPYTDEYSSSLSAIESLSRSNFLSASTVAFNQAFVVGAIVTKKGVTDFTTGDVTFITTNGRGDFGAGSGSQGATVGSYLEIANNLSDLADTPTSRTNLDVYSKLETDLLSVLVDGGFIKNSTSNSKSTLGGSIAQPNLIGIEVHAEYFVSDGVTNTYNVTAPFIINDLTRINVRCNVIRKSDGAGFSYNDGSGITVNSGYGTSTINVTIATLPSNGDLVEFTVYGENDDALSDPELITTLGYDNSVNPIMSNAFGAHGIIFNGGGHNTIKGGSYSRIWSSFSEANGKFIFLGRRNKVSSTFLSAVGQGIFLDGTFSRAEGGNIDVNGDKVFARGFDLESDGFDNLTIEGFRTKAVASNEVLRGYGLAGDSVNGIFQKRVIGLRRETTDGTEQSMNVSGSGATNIPINDNSSAHCSIKVVAYIDDYTKSETFEGTFLVTKTGGVTRVNNSTGDINVPSVQNIGAPLYNIDLRGLSGNLIVRATGAVGENVRFLAEVELLQIQY